MYWRGEDVLQPADAPPLTRAICGWAPRLLGAPQPRDTNGWKDRDAYMIGAEILDRPNIRARRLLFYTRLPFLFFPLLIVFLLWHWGRQLFGEPIGLFLARAARWSRRFSAVSYQLGRACRFGEPSGLPTRRGNIGAPNLPRLLISSLATAAGGADQIYAAAIGGRGVRAGSLKGPRLGAIAIPLAVYVESWPLRSFRRRRSPTERNNSAARRAPLGAPGVKLLAVCRGRSTVRGLLYVGGSLQGDGFTGYMLGHRIRSGSAFPLACDRSQSSSVAHRGWTDRSWHFGFGGVRPVSPTC
jgi:hypothetical protein